LEAILHKIAFVVFRPTGI